MKKIPHIFLVFLSVILTVVLAMTLLFSAFSYSIRTLYTPEYVYNLMNSIDYASLEVPDGNGNAVSLCDVVNEQIRDFGIAFTEQDLNTAVHTFSIDAVLSSFVQEVRTWLLDDGSAPTLDPDSIADTILSGLDQSLLSFFSYFGDPQTALSDALHTMTDAVDLHTAFEQAEPFRELLSSGSLVFALSLCGTLFLLLLITRRLRLVQTMQFTGCAGICAGSVFLFLPAILAPFKAQVLAAVGMPTATVDIFWLPLMESCHRTGTFLALGGLTLLVVFSVISAFASMIKREKIKSEELAARRMQKAGDSDTPNFVPEQTDMQEKLQNKNSNPMDY